MTTFADLGLSQPILRALSEERYENPTPIQAQTIPHLLAGRDVVGIAQTGTGKTAAFALPILHHLANQPVRAERKSCRVLVLSPTRELSSQIVDSFKTYGRHLRVSVTLAIGGVPIGRQQRALANGIDVLVATPGRLLDLIHTGAVRIDLVEFFVLDEADRMLDMGFINDIRKIVRKLPSRRHSLFFSATMPREIEELAGSMLRDPASVAVTPVASTAERIAQRVVHVEKAAKTSLLADILRKEPIDRVLVFTRTKHGADRVVRQLGQRGIESDAIHGNKSQNQRERALLAFREGRIRTLVATDIAARGIDVDGISHVVNFDLPNVPESYVHRIGRTARAGADGTAISFCDSEERSFLRQIEKLIRMSIPASTHDAPPDRVHEPARSQPQDHRPARPHGQQDRKRHSAAGHGQRQTHPRNPHGKPARGTDTRPQNTNGHQNRDNARGAQAQGDMSGLSFMGKPRRKAGGSKQFRAPR
ncbi:MAG: DEAD/DEAH box helicase [Pseudorhodoplanes sp.]